MLYLLFLAVLILIVFWEDVRREKRINDFLKIFNEFKNHDCFLDKLFGFFQRILDYIFNKIFIRQILNPYFLFPFTILFSFYLYFVKKTILSDLVYFITFVAILWYSRETWALRKEQVKSNEILAGRPLVIVSKGEGNFICVKNFGTSIAKKILIRLMYEEKEISSKEFLVLGKGQEIKYAIPGDAVRMIETQERQFFIYLEYRSFNKHEKYKATFIIDETILVDSEKGGFKLVNEKIVKIDV